VIAIAGSVTAKLWGVLTAENGVPAAVAALSAEQAVELPSINAEQIIAQNVAPEIAERSTASKYPLVYVYCSKIVNSLTEKFRTFSGNAQMVVEARVSQDRLDNLETNLQTYVDAITQVLESNRGDWGDGVYFNGGYEITFGPVKHGGRNLLQSAKVAVVLEVSSD